MPLDYEIDIERDLITLRGHAILTNQELVSCVGRLRADPDIRHSMPTMADLSAVDRMEVTGPGINSMLAVLRATAHPESHAKVAILTDSEAHVFIARLIEALAEAEEASVRIRAFSRRDEAERWLGEP